MKTKNGIELNLKESKYKFSYEGMTFYFSSEFYLKKFQNLLLDYIETESIKLYNRYKIHVNFKQFLALSCYKRIEKRGFYVNGYDNFEISENIEINDTY